MSAFPTGITAISCIALSGWVLSNVAADGPFCSGESGDESPIEYAFECANSSTPPEVIIKTITDDKYLRCNWPTITPVSSGSSVKHHIHYACCRNLPMMFLPTSAQPCLPENDCDSCKNPYSRAMCQYDLFSLGRFWPTCIPLLDEITKLEAIDIAPDKEPPYEGWRITDPDYGKRPKPHMSGRPYCDDGKLSMVIHPCCNPPLMVVVDKKNCLQKVTCGTRPEANALFKTTRNWNDWPPVYISSYSSWRDTSWTGPFYNAWDRISSEDKYVLNKALNKIDACMNITDHTAPVDQVQCSRCKAQTEVVRLYDHGLVLGQLKGGENFIKIASDYNLH
ncbi:uncharacterized protein LOC129581220 [Paramacrobiotus metropolitanus]|uniref:uncharacterized protein LOC129581220 n=1 Tax=Paramacrobiotus metropolitanus TaxID=2943436 RepID=UPI002445EE99|nr:uncharacterized protein LOC129581220 [Paramacrobiotus metropolitanus]